MTTSEPITTTPHFGDPVKYDRMCFDGTERATNFYWRNRALCDSALFVGVFAIIAVLLHAAA
jgi:hypothetical protein